MGKGEGLSSNWPMFLMPVFPSLCSYDFIFLDFSPQRVVFSGWVGDEDPTFDGLVQALKRYLQSAWAGRIDWTTIQCAPVTVIINKHNDLPCSVFTQSCHPPKVILLITQGSF